MSEVKIYGAELSAHKFYDRTHPALILVIGLVGVDGIINYLDFNSSAFRKLVLGQIRTNNLCHFVP